MAKTDSMDLQGFITSTLVQIVKGVNDAISEIEDVGNGAVINPAMRHSNHADPKEVSFDVAVTVSEGKSGSGSGRIKVIGFDIGGGKDRSHSTEAVSRIRFTVPIAAPSTKIKQYNT